jgi:hypothetical protein
VVQYHRERAVTLTSGDHRWLVTLRKPATFLAAVVVFVTLAAALKPVVGDLGIAISITALAAITLAPAFASRSAGGRA